MAVRKPAMRRTTDRALSQRAPFSDRKQKLSQASTPPVPEVAFVEIPRAFLKSIATGSDRIPTLYFSENIFARKFFWLRLRMIHRMMHRLDADRRNCLDFCGGGGVFLPTLASAFDNVVCVDLETEEAFRVKQRFGLENVQMVQADIASTSLPGAPFFNIVAADVLEHFRDLSVPVKALRAGLDANGRLFTSLPTENWVYVALRKLFRIRKPADHYHTACEVETFLRDSGFKCVSRCFVPLYFPIFPLFSICAWRLADEN